MPFMVEIPASRAQLACHAPKQAMVSCPTLLASTADTQHLVWRPALIARLASNVQISRASVPIAQLASTVSPSSCIATHAQLAVTARTRTATPLAVSPAFTPILKRPRAPSALQAARAVSPTRCQEYVLMVPAPKLEPPIAMAAPPVSHARMALQSRVRRARSLTSMVPIAWRVQLA